MAEASKAILRSEYRPYPYELKKTKLRFDIHDGATTVDCELEFVRRPPTNESAAPSRELVLHGGRVELSRLAVDGRELGGNEFKVDGETLTIFDAPDKCQVAVRTRIAPEANTELEGLYKSGTMYCTQCEAEGFRHITYYPDRPDVLAKFTTTVTADADRYPVLLSNGNLTADRTEGGRRTVTWHDPFPKPSYLFALVAGHLAVLEDEFVTMSGRRVALRIYSEPHNVDQCGYAMDVLKRAMRWDEERFGREYDLDIFMVVAVEDFNFGAMENKGLNIFNTSAVLASADTATDAAHQRVEGVVAHEYFHNWSGNRVTCRSWFELSLKEGFTVYRDAEFSADMNSRTVKRVEDVEALRATQFVEDASPLAHEVRPESYEAIDNFYTRTVYEKGAEVVGMLATILGQDGFRKGTDLYFERHDGDAVTIEDFVAAMEAANDVDLTQFRLWYSQKGTPRVRVTETRADGRLELAVEQLPAPVNPGGVPLHVPLALGLVDSAGQELLGAAGARGGARVEVAGDLKVENPNADGTLIAHLKGHEARLSLSNVPGDAEVSFLRGFSAPVQVEYVRGLDTLRRLALNDTDGFARWDAAQSIYARCLLSDDATADGSAEAAVSLVRALVEMAADAPDDGEAKALFARMLTLPRESTLLELAPGSDVLAIAARWDRLAGELADAVDCTGLVVANDQPGPYRPDPVHIARRSLRLRALWYAVRHCDRHVPEAAVTMLSDMLVQSDNLTERLAALNGILGMASVDTDRKQGLVDEFYGRWSGESLVVDAWFAAQARNPLPGGLERVRALEKHGAFNMDNPNKVRALIGAFTDNVRNFHAEDGSGYRWLADHVLDIDARNAKLAARLATKLTEWKSHDQPRQKSMCRALATLRAAKSKNVLEVVEKGLQEAPEF